MPHPSVTQGLQLDASSFPALERSPSSSASNPPAGPNWAAVAGKRLFSMTPHAVTAAVRGRGGGQGVTAHRSATVTTAGRAGPGVRAVGGTGRSGGWVSTGVAVTAQYEEAREEARGWARARNMCFQQVRSVGQVSVERSRQQFAISGTQESDPSLTDPSVGQGDSM